MLNVDVIMKIIIFILVIIALFTLFYRKGGGMKKAIIEVLIAIVLAVLSPLIQEGYNYSWERFSDMMENTRNESTNSQNESIYTDEKRSDSELEHIHKEYKKEKENVNDANCLNMGSYELVVYCECGKELSRERITVEALNHDFEATVTKATCSAQGSTKFICNRCGESYIDDYVDALGHDYKNGVCERCGEANPEYVKEYDGEGIMKTLSKSVVNSNSFYQEYLGTESISVLAEERYNCFAIGMTVSYNIWGNNVQNVTFNISSLNEFEKLNFDIGGESGYSGSVKVEIFVDKTVDETADYTQDIETSFIPINASIYIKDATLLNIRVTNYASNSNNLVFFNFSVESD